MVQSTISVWFHNLKITKVRDGILVAAAKARAHFNFLPYHAILFEVHIHIHIYIYTYYIIVYLLFSQLVSLAILWIKAAGPSAGQPPADVVGTALRRAGLEITADNVLRALKACHGTAVLTELQRFLFSHL